MDLADIIWAIGPPAIPAAILFWMTRGNPIRGRIAVALIVWAVLILAYAFASLIIACEFYGSCP